MDGGLDLAPFDIPLVWTAAFKDSLFPYLPRQHIQGDIRRGDGSVRCVLQDVKRINQGRYGVIWLVNRTDSSGASIQLASKRPNHDCQKEVLATEAILQHIASQILIEKGIHGAVPPVHDIYLWVNESRFTMDYIEGNSALEEIYKAEDPGLTLLQVLAQLCIVLAVLETTIRLDHRDLKMTNLWVQKKPVNYKLGPYTVQAPFQVVFLDFGFTCVGNADGLAVVNLGNGVFPDLDPCPKDGRNLFHCLSSLWSVPVVRDRIPAALRVQIEGWFHGYGALSKRFADPGLSWIYLIVGAPEFSLEDLSPLILLDRIAKRWPAVVSVAAKAKDSAL